jgi:hypothetical protein
MPDPITNIFQTTLLVMYFITPAETVHLKPGQKTDFEKSKIWTLQSTNQIPTENPNMCVANGKLLLQEFEQVSTIAVRAYCLCPEHPAAPGDACDKAKGKNLDFFTAKHLTPPPATIIPIGPDTLMPGSSGPATQ